jgi:hypothetical protein
MGKFSDYDIPAQKYDFFTDLKFGKKGEQLVDDFLKALSEGAFEVKTDRYRNGKMVLEIEHNPRRRKDDNGVPVWEKSGLSVTKAKWWVYVYTLDNGQGAFVVLSVPRIKKFLKVNKAKFSRDTMMKFAPGSSNPSRGYLLLPEDVQDMMINPAYDQ